MLNIKSFKKYQLNEDIINGIITIFVTLSTIIGLLPILDSVYGTRNIPYKIPKNIQNLKNFDITNYFNKIKRNIKDKLKLNLLSDKNFIKKINDIYKKINIEQYKIRLQNIINEENDITKLQLWREFQKDLRLDIESKLSNDEQYFTGFILDYFLNDDEDEMLQNKKIYESNSIKITSPEDILNVKKFNKNSSFEELYRVLEMSILNKKFINHLFSDNRTTLLTAINKRLKDSLDELKYNKDDFKLKIFIKNLYLLREQVINLGGKTTKELSSINI